LPRTVSLFAFESPNDLKKRGETKSPNYNFFYLNKYFNFYFSFLVFFSKIKSTPKSFFLLPNYSAYFLKSNAKKLSTSKKIFKF